MAVIGTFGSFTAARMGIYSSQASLNLTGNNIANINTKGYTRQRLDLVSLNAGNNSRYVNRLNLNIGYGVIAESTSQLRDPFLDIRYRQENTNVGAYAARVDGLQQLANILDEVGDGDGDFGIIEAQFNDLMQQLQILSRNAGSKDQDTVVRSSAESLVKLFNSYSKALDKAESNQLERLQGDVETVNTLLTQIRNLNVQIREAGLFKNNALELRDQRNLYIDELSSYMNINVRYDMEKIDEYSEVERLTITLADSGNPPITLIQGIYGTQLSMPEKTSMRNPYYERNFTPADPKNPTADELQKMLKYVETLDKDGKPATFTDDPDKAIEINNAVNGASDNRLWIELEPLEDKFGHIMKNADGTLSEKVELKDNDLYGSLQTMRELLTEKGEFTSKLEAQYDKDASTKRGIPYYRHALDNLARKFAETMNEANSVKFVGYETEKDANGVERYTIKPGTNCDLVTGNGDAVTLVTELQAAGFDKEYLTRVDLSDLPADLQTKVKELQNKHLSADGQGHGVPKLMGGNLFSNRGDNDDGTGITAANISIAKSWAVGTVRIRNTNETDGSHTTAADNITHMISLMESKMLYYPKDVIDDPDSETKYFEGTFQEMLTNINGTLAKDQQISRRLYDSYTTNTLTLENDRQSVSGVDLNEEATNMMQYQKSYSAACQLMTTLDSMLDKLINGTIR